MTFQTDIFVERADPGTENFTQTRPLPHRAPAPRLLRRQPTRLYGGIGKRGLDIAIVIAAAPVALVLIALLCPLIMLDGGKPFFRQARVGRRGHIFHMLKLRSMVRDAEQRLEAHLAANPESRQEWDETQKLRCDPRITAVGRFIRKSSLDELPQLWNVLKGEMSIVGPRPMMPSQRPLYPGTAYFALRPGITGLWQISARNASTFADRGDFDARYYRSVSLKTDLGIILRTFRVVLRGTGC